jgi:hypothetical protein
MGRVLHDDTKLGLGARVAEEFTANDALVALGVSRPVCASIFVE